MRRKRALFIALTLSVPFLFIAGVEVVLQTIDVWPDLSLFTTVVFRGRTYAVMNPAVKDRYFARTAFSPATSQDCFPVPKPPGTFRIFCLGGSTTVGYPHWFNGSFSSFLRDRLRRIFPERPIEVINIGMTATNSYTVVDMARALRGFEPDLLLVYDGHNEFYGALGAASRESLNTPRWLTSLYLRLLGFRTVLAAREIIASLTGSGKSFVAPQPLGTMMEQLARDRLVPYRSPIYTRALEDFRDNLEELKGICADLGAVLMLSTQVSNLRDQPPFVSSTPGGPPAEHLAGLLERGERQFSLGCFDSALVSLRNALPIDTLCAETHYKIARCLDALGRVRDAEQAYRRARDYDQLRFRASSDFNNAILSTGNDSTVLVADMEEVFRGHSPDSLIGTSLLFEHLHPRARGQFLMARAFAALMRVHGILVPPAAWAAADTVSDRELWDARCMTVLDELAARRRTAVLVSGWPFTDRRPDAGAVDGLDTLAQIVEMHVRGEWPWPEAHQRAAAFYRQRNDREDAAREYRVLINQLPLLTVQPYLRLAGILREQGKTVELGRVLLASLTVEPTTFAYRALGDLSVRAGRLAEAISHYRHAFDLPQSDQEKAEIGCLLAEAFLRAGQMQQARNELRGVFLLRPEYGPALELQKALPVEGR